MQTIGSAAPSLVAPGLAFMFTAHEPAAVAAAVNVTAMWANGSVFEATCQQTYSSLFRGLAPPFGVRIAIRCPQCAVYSQQRTAFSIETAFAKPCLISLSCAHASLPANSVCNDRTAFVASRVTGCAAQNLFAPEHSDVCLTAIHAGLLTGAGGQFSIQAAAAGIDYQGCVGNGTIINRFACTGPGRESSGSIFNILRRVWWLCRC